jgi:hypothetical protein
MAKQEEPRASLAERRRRGPASGRRPLAVLASFGVLLVVSWPVAAIAKKDHGGGQDRGGGSAGERHSGKGHSGGKGRRGGGGPGSGGRSGDHSQAPSGDAGNSGHHAKQQGRRGGGRGRGENHGHGGNKGRDKNNKRDRQQGSGDGTGDAQPSRVTGSSSPAIVSAPAIPVPAPTPQVVAPSVPAPISSPPAPALPTPAPGALPLPSPDVLPGPLSDATPEGGSPTGVPPLTQQPPGTSPAGGTELGAPSVSSAAAAILDGISGNDARAGKDKGDGGRDAASSGGLDGERSGITGAAQRGAAKVVKVIPAYMWAASSTLLVLTLLLAAATWLVAGPGRRPVRDSAGSFADTAPVPMPLPVPIPRSRARTSAPAPTPLVQEEPRLYEGEILLHAGPFGDADALADFERRLAGLPLVHDVRVGHFQGDRVLINLRLAGPTDLAHELRHEFGPAVGVASSGPSELVADMSPRGS